MMLNRHGSKPSKNQRNLRDNLPNLRETLNLREICPIALIAAMDRNRVIGKDGKMPWHLPEDLHWFKTNTLGHPVLMGRRTFDSLPGPLPGRLNLVLSRDASYTVPPDVVKCSSLEDAFQALQQGAAESQTAGLSHPPLFVIGGATLVSHFLPQAAYLYLSLIDADYEGDTWFPEYNSLGWNTLYEERIVSASGIPISFLILERNQ